MEIGDQLYVNNKWYFDIMDIKDGTVVIRIKYKENPKKDIFLYRQIALDINLFKDIKEKSFIKTCNIDVIELKNIIGTLIDRIVKENDITAMFEDGMGSVSMAGVNSTPGMLGTAGSGDITTMPNNTIGFEIVTKDFKRINKKIKSKKKHNPIIKTPIINLQKESFFNNKEKKDETTDNEYKKLIFDFLDYPTDNDYDNKIIDVINKIRKTFVTSSSDVIKSYFKNLYELNKSYIKNKTSEWFQNNILIIIDSKK